MKTIFTLFLFATLTFGEDQDYKADTKSIAAINERLTELSVRNEALQKEMSDLKTENNAVRKEVVQLKTENSAMRKTDAILRNADAQLRLADARLRDVDAKILKDTKRQNVELRRDNQAQRQAGPNRQEDYVHMKIDVDESMRELMQTEIRKYHSVHDNTKLLKNLTESMTRIQNDLGQLKAAANSSGNEAGEIHDKDVHDEDVDDKDDKEVLVLKHDFTKESPFKDNGWNEYKSGFGKKGDKNYWLGLEKIPQITSSGSWNLKVRVKYDILFGGQPDPLAGTIGEAQWKAFSIAGESDKYRLHIGEMTSSSNFPSGDLFKRHPLNGQAFSTVDRDNEYSCAKSRGGGWWFRSCTYICLTCSRDAHNNYNEILQSKDTTRLPSEASMWLIKQG